MFVVVWAKPQGLVDFDLFREKYGYSASFQIAIDAIFLNIETAEKWIKDSNEYRVKNGSARLEYVVKELV